MTLFLIIIFLVLISLVSNFIPKYSKYLEILACIFIISFYFLLSYNFSDNFFPQKYQKENDSKYNMLVNAIKNKKLYICDISELSQDTINMLHQPDIQRNYKIYCYKNVEIPKLLDLSFYDNKLFMYWGISPLILLFLPFNIITGLCLTEQLSVFLSCSFIFILSLLILKTFFKKFLNYSLEPNEKVLVIFFTGLCNYCVFLDIKPEIYEFTISFASIFLLLSIYLFLKYLLTNNQTNKNRIIFFMGLFLSFAVGARPNYVLFIPIFFIFILYLNIKSKNIWNMVIFIMPCIFYGFIITAYNYLRFDSIFEFGWKYQLNDQNQINYIPQLQDFLIGLKYNLFQPLKTNGIYTLFEFALAKGHRISNEFIIGLIYIYPLSIITLFLIPFAIKTTTKLTKTVIILIFLIFVINFCLSCVFGMAQRYVFEYIYILVILSLMIFFTLKSYLSYKQMIILKKLTTIFFTAIFIVTAYINISLLFCIHETLFIIESNNVNFYTNIINFLFNCNITQNFFLDKEFIINYISINY